MTQKLQVSEIDFIELMERRTHENIDVSRALLDDRLLLNSLEMVAKKTSEVMSAGGKVLLFGNGGSAAQAQHIATELVGRYKRERRGLPALALTVDSACLTAVANDYSFDQVFARQVEALGARDDIVFAISTSGNSPSVLHGIDAAKSRGMIAVGLTGRTGGNLKARVDHCIQVPSDDTPRIQEAHLLIGHTLCEYVEEVLTQAKRASDSFGAGPRNLTKREDP